MRVYGLYGRQSLSALYAAPMLFAGRGSKTKGRGGEALKDQRNGSQAEASADEFQSNRSVNGSFFGVGGGSLVDSPDSPPSSVGSRGADSCPTPADSSVAADGEWETRFEQLSPVLAKWFRPPHFKPGSKIEFLSLPDAVLKGLESSLRQGASRKKSGRSSSGLVSPHLEAFLPGVAQVDFDRGQVFQQLQQAKEQLQQLAHFAVRGDAAEASQFSKQLLHRFLEEPGRLDHSAGAFLTAFSQQKLTTGSAHPCPDWVPQVQMVLEDLQGALAEQRRVALDPFEKACPTLSKYSDNWVRRAEQGQLPEVFMRREVTERMLALMNSGGARTNLVLQAPAGEGKTHALWSLAQRFARQEVPKAFQGAQVLQLDIPALKAEGLYKGTFEGTALEAFGELRRYLQFHPRQKVVLLIDDAHALPEGQGIASLAELLKDSALLDQPNLTLIASVTPERWSQSPLATDPAFLGRFYSMTLPPFQDNEQLALLSHSAQQLENQSGVAIPAALLEKTLRQVRTRWPQGTLGHARDVLNLAVTLAQENRLPLATLQDKLQAQRLWVAALEKKEADGLNGRCLRQLEEARRQSAQLQQAIDAQEKLLQSPNTGPSGRITLGMAHVQQALAIATGASLEGLNQQGFSKLRNAEAILAQSIVGQPEALKAIAQGLREIVVRNKTGVVRNCPMVSMLFPGPTGVGKTEAARVIAREFMQGHLIRLDMSDYMEKHAASLLTGAPPGYVGYEQGGLVDQVRRYPKSVVVFDEIEKAHPDVFNLLLQILGEGELRNNRGEAVSFRDTVVILTSNLNHQALTDLVTRHRQSPQAKQDPQLAATALEKQVRALLTAHPDNGHTGFKPEHLGRIDYVIPFNPLVHESVGKILEIQLQQLNALPFLQERDLRVSLSSAALARLETLARTQEQSPQGEAAQEHALPITGGARAIGTQFDRYVGKCVLFELTMNPELEALENTKIQVDYEPLKKSFTLRCLS